MKASHKKTPMKTVIALGEGESYFKYKAQKY